VPTPEAAAAESEVFPSELRAGIESIGGVLESMDEAVGAGAAGPLAPAREVPGADAVPVDEPLAGVGVAVAVALAEVVACGLLGAAVAGFEFELAGELWLPAGDFDPFAGPAGLGEVNGEPVSTTPGPDT
jgi:hypothetical protein